VPRSNAQDNGPYLTGFGVVDYENIAQKLITVTGGGGGDASCARAHVFVTDSRRLKNCMKRVTVNYTDTYAIERDNLEYR
jgi:hypothetical protein